MKQLKSCKHQCCIRVKHIKSNTVGVFLFFSDVDMWLMNYVIWVLKSVNAPEEQRGSHFSLRHNGLFGSPGLPEGSERRLIATVCFFVFFVFFI